MKTELQTPTFADLERLSLEKLEELARVAELAIAKPYFLDRLRVAIALKRRRL